MSQTQKKRAIIIGAILGVLLVAGIAGSLVIKLSQPVYTKLSIALMPESMEYTDSDGVDRTFYIEQNKKYDSKKDDPINAYTVYYLDENDKRVELENGIYMSATQYAESKKKKADDSENKSDSRSNIGEGEFVTVGFLFKAQEKANKVLKIVRIVTVIFALCCAAYAIYLWYLSWSKREDEKKEKLAEVEDILKKKKEE